jgi:hypothetical protein
MRRKLNHALCILEAAIDIVGTISDYSNALEEPAGIGTRLQQAFQRELQQISNDLRQHARTVRKLLSFSEDIRLLVLDLYPYTIVPGINVLADDIRTTRSSVF